MNKSNNFSPKSVNAQSAWCRSIGCVPQTLLNWIKRAEVDAGVRERFSRANEILKRASAFFAQAESSRRLKS